MNPINDQEKLFLEDLQFLKNEVERLKGSSKFERQVSLLANHIFSKWMVSQKTVEQLTNRIKDLSQIEGELDIEKIEDAIVGLSLILNEKAPKSSKANASPSELKLARLAIDKLIEAHTILETRAQGNEELPGSLLASNRNDNNDNNAKPRVSWSNRIFSSFNTYFEVAASRSSDSSAEALTEESFEQIAPQEELPSVEEQALMAELHRIYRFERHDASQLVRSLLTGEDVNHLIPVKNPMGPEVINVPSVFHADFIRANLVQVNGKIVRQMVSEGTENEVNDESKSDNSQAKFDGYKHLMTLVGSKTFNRLATLLNQAFTATAIIELVNKREGSNLNINENIFFDGMGLSHIVQVTDKSVDINSLVILQVYDTHQNKPDGTPGKILGYIGVRLHTFAPRAEFDRPFEQRADPSQYVPKVKASLTYSGFFPTAKAAERAAKSSLYRNLGSFFY